MTLPAFVQNVIVKLEHSGFEAFAVGGAVRDFLLGKAPTDWDIATSAQPQEVIDTLGAENCIPTGIKHGTITYVTDKQALEITTYRIDGEYQDNRHPKNVRFSKNIFDDLSRRDFTINAMAHSPRTGIIDPFGGQDDLSLRLVRAVGEASKRFCEDSLRIIRALRFAAVLNFDIDTNTKCAIHLHKHLMKNIAKERIQSELSKLVMADNPQTILKEFSDVFASIFNVCREFNEAKWIRNASLLHGCAQIRAVRLAILLDGMAAHQILHFLKYDNKTIYYVKTILKYIDLEISPDPIFIKHILSEIGTDMLSLVLEAKRAKYNCDITAANNIVEQILATNQCYLQKHLAIDGNDLIKLGFTGTEIGRTLNFLLNEVIEESCENKRSALETLAKEKRNTV